MAPDTSSLKARYDQPLRLPANTKLEDPKRSFEQQRATCAEGDIVLSINVEVQLLLLERNGSTLSASSSLYDVNSDRLVEGEDLLRLFIIPAGFSLSYRAHARHTVRGEFRYVRVVSRGSPSSRSIGVFDRERRA